VRLLNFVFFKKIWATAVEGWCLGRNPSFVLSSIQLSGLPAPHADLTGAYLPLHPRVSRFTVSNGFVNELKRIILIQLLDVSFLLRCQSSRLTPHGVAVPHCGWSFLSSHRGEPAAAHRLTNPLKEKTS